MRGVPAIRRAASRSIRRIAPVPLVAGVVGMAAPITTSQTAALPQPHNADPLAWAPDTLQLLDEAHLVATSPRPEVRDRFSADLGRFIARLPWAELCPLHGRFIADLDSLRFHLDQGLGLDAEHLAEHLAAQPRRPGASLGLTERLRARAPRRRGVTHRYYLWNDADRLLRADPDLFARVIDAVAGVAAEAEYASDDVLLIHRLIAVGGSCLSLYASQPGGAFDTWWTDLHQPDTHWPAHDPSWAMLTGIPAPAFAIRTIEDLAIAAPGASAVG